MGTVEQRDSLLSEVVGATPLKVKIEQPFVQNDTTQGFLHWAGRDLQDDLQSPFQFYDAMNC